MSPLPPAAESALIDALSSHVLLWHQPSRSAACKNERCPMPVTHVEDRDELLYVQAHHQAEVLSEAHLLAQPISAPQEPRERVLTPAEQVAFRKDWDARVVESGSGGVRHPGGATTIMGTR